MLEDTRFAAAAVCAVLVALQLLRLCAAFAPPGRLASLVWNKAAAPLRSRCLRRR
jgi:hypothetical protein